MSDLFEKYDRESKESDEKATKEQDTSVKAPDAPVVFDDVEDEPVVYYTNQEEKIVFDTSIPLETASSVSETKGGKTAYLEEEDEEDEEDEDIKKENPRSLKILVLSIAGCLGFIFLSLYPLLCSDSSDEKSIKSIVQETPKTITPKSQTRDTPYTRRDLLQQADIEERRERSRKNKKPLEKMSKEELRKEVSRLENQVAELEVKNQFCEQQAQQKDSTIVAGASNAASQLIGQQTRRLPSKKRPGNRNRRSQNHSQNASKKTDETEDMILDPSFYGSSAVVITNNDSSSDSTSKYEIPAGHKIPVKLTTGVSSAAASSKVVAKVTKTVTVGGAEIYKGSVLTGHIGSARGGKIFIDFSRITVRGKKYRLSGYAISGDMPGLVARLVGGNKGGKSSASRVAENTAGSAASDVISHVVPGGDVISNTAKRLAQESINEARRSGSSGSGSTRAILELKAGTKFFVLTTGG